MLCSQIVPSTNERGSTGLLNISSRLATGPFRLNVNDASTGLVESLVYPLASTCLAFVFGIATTALGTNAASEIVEDVSDRYVVETFMASARDLMALTSTASRSTTISGPARLDVWPAVNV